MQNEKLTKEELRQFTGTETWYRHSLAKNILYTDGIQYMAEKAQAYWIIDKIALIQWEIKYQRVKFQCWTLKVDLDAKTGVLTCDDGNGNIISEKKLPYTDFPLDEIKIFFCDNVILLPSEY